MYIMISNTYIVYLVCTFDGKTFHPSIYTFKYLFCVLTKKKQRERKMKKPTKNRTKGKENIGHNKTNKQTSHVTNGNTIFNVETLQNKGKTMAPCLVERSRYKEN